MTTPLTSCLSTTLIRFERHQNRATKSLRDVWFGPRWRDLLQRYRRDSGVVLNRVPTNSRQKLRHLGTGCRSHRWGMESDLLLLHHTSCPPWEVLKRVFVGSKPILFTSIYSPLTSCPYFLLRFRSMFDLRRSYSRHLSGTRTLGSIGFKLTVTKRSLY